MVNPEGRKKPERLLPWTTLWRGRPQEQALKKVATMLADERGGVRATAVVPDQKEGALIARFSDAEGAEKFHAAVVSYPALAEYVNSMQYSPAPSSRGSGPSVLLLPKHPPIGSGHVLHMRGRMLISRLAKALDENRHRLAESK